jgi:hypothetical protein
MHKHTNISGSKKRQAAGRIGKMRQSVVAPALADDQRVSPGETG